MILGELFGIASARAVQATDAYRALKPEEAKALYKSMWSRAFGKAPALLGS